MVRLATALFGMTTSNVLLVTRGTANLMGGQKVVVKEQPNIRNNSKDKPIKHYLFEAFCLISSLMLVPCSNDPLALPPLSCN